MFGHPDLDGPVKLKPFLVKEKMDTSGWTGKDFEFVITGDVQISTGDYDRLLAPNSFKWRKKTVKTCNLYFIDQEAYSFSQEEDGIHMSFTPGFAYPLARQIVDEIIQNLREAGKVVGLVVWGFPILYLNCKKSLGK